MNCILAGTWNTWPHLSELKLKELNKLSQKGKPGPLTDVLSSKSLPGVSLCLGSIHCGKCSVYLLYSSLTSVLPPKIVLGSVVQHSKIVSTNRHFQNSSCIFFFFWCWLLIFYFISHCIHDTFLMGSACDVKRDVFVCLTCRQMHIFFKWKYCIPLSFPDHIAFVLIAKRNQRLMCTY